MSVALETPDVTYFKRYRMEADLSLPPPPVPFLPIGFAWIPWSAELNDTHAAVKFKCFRDDLDGVVFPNLRDADGCRRLMREIADKPGFRPEATWLISHGENYVGTVQGIFDRAGTGCVQNLGVIPSYRGQGLGWALLLQVMHCFRRFGLANTRLEVTAKNEQAVRLYRRAGFRYRKTLYRTVDALTYALADIDWMV
ncbi:MAG: GNAT family N-acetyltransferase [Gemmataceae bacterium]|nr:GNAT family N-acetyltransferase [Gemmataceae bacterium]